MPNLKKFQDDFLKRTGVDLTDDEAQSYNKGLSKIVMGPTFMILIMIVVLIIVFMGINTGEFVLDTNTYAVLFIILMCIIFAASSIQRGMKKYEDKFLEERKKNQFGNIGPATQPISQPIDTNVPYQNNTNPIGKIITKTPTSTTASNPINSNKVKAAVIIGVLVISIVIIIFAIPKGPLIGTWKTESPTTFYVGTDFDTWPNPPEDIGYEIRTVTWKITSGSENGTVNIEFSFTITDYSILTGKNYVPPVSPESYTGVISGTTLTVYSIPTGFLEDNFPRVAGVFTFTDNTITGTWDDTWELVYAQRTYTAQNGLILVK